MRKLLVFTAVALLIPAVALAGGKPGNPGKSATARSNAAPKVMYVLKGTLTAYSAAQGSADGSVTIMVKSANYHGRALHNQTLTIAVTSSTKLVGLGSFKANDDGIVKVRAAKAAKGTTGAALMTALQAAKAYQVVDQGPAGS